ncbi:MAG: flavin reductase family protein [Alphaproteobacteria bacterium]|nr:flavin reductase family protein [Alphaproteobacteria bacterium]MBO6863230.1 flavin reductase family protein [Alphaproteobacteria bacterium]MEC9265645.1 flavin reductase family protein [Pseudomonadota bacterium]
MEIASDTLTPGEAYRLLVGAVVPRPIAWVSTLSATGTVNAAPFSCFTFVSYSPPMVAISVGRKGDSLKDTPANIMRDREFVVNIADVDLASVLHETSAELPPDQSELDLVGLNILPSHRVAVPRIAEVPVALECRLHDILEFGKLKTQLIVGEVVTFHVRDDLYSNGKIDSMKLRPLARLGGPRYMETGREILSRPIPATFG